MQILQVISENFQPCFKCVSPFHVLNPDPDYKLFIIDIFSDGKTKMNVLLIVERPNSSQIHVQIQAYSFLSESRPPTYTSTVPTDGNNPLQSFLIHLLL